MFSIWLFMRLRGEASSIKLWSTVNFILQRMRIFSSDQFPLFKGSILMSKLPKFHQIITYIQRIKTGHIYSADSFDRLNIVWENKENSQILETNVLNLLENFAIVIIVLVIILLLRKSFSIFHYRIYSILYPMFSYCHNPSPKLAE